jgi:hypothetical protein
LQRSNIDVESEKKNLEIVVIRRNLWEEKNNEIENLQNTIQIE